MRFRLLSQSRQLVKEHDADDIELATEYFILWLSSHLCPPALRREEEEPGRVYTKARVTLTFRGPTYYVEAT